jgi:hypothetical protein
MTFIRSTFSHILFSNFAIVMVVWWWAIQADADEVKNGNTCDWYKEKDVRYNVTESGSERMNGIL